MPLDLQEMASRTVHETKQEDEEARALLPRLD